MRKLGGICFLGIALAGGPSAPAQIVAFPFIEKFDSVTPPSLPPGWITSTNRTASGDFVTSSSSPRSSPNCAFSSNSTISQSLTSPAFDFSNRTPDKLQFFTARSTTHTSGLLVEASVDNGATFALQLSDTLKNPGTTSYVLTAIQLPSSLANQRAVKLRWRVVGGAGGATATLRLDDISLTVRITYDLALTRLSIEPPSPTSSDALTAVATVRNLGIVPVSSYSVKFFHDDNNNQFPDPLELFASINGAPVAPSESALVVASHPPVIAGDHRLISVLSFPQDEVGSNDTLRILFSAGYPKGSLLLNEIMYAPSGDEPEWVELFNPTADTMNLRNWRISDNNVTVKSLITTSSVAVGPGGYAIVAKDQIISTIHPNIHSPVVIANFSALNNTTPDAVVLYDFRSATIDSLAYAPAWGGQDGKSLERVDTERPATEAPNWGTSHDSSGSTPGSINSIVRLTFDLAAGRIYQTQATDGERVVPVVNFFVRNLGKEPASAFSVKFFADTNRNGIPDPAEILREVSSLSTIRPDDSLLFSYEWSSAPSGESEVYGVVDNPQDQRTTNNSASLLIQISYGVRSLVMNEIMYDPLPGQNEWIELYHRGDSPIDIGQWKISDRPTVAGNSNAFFVSLTSEIVLPGEFIVVAAESTILSLFPSLLNQIHVHLAVLNRPAGFGLSSSGDDVILKDLTGKTIDSVSFLPVWHHPDVADTKGRSLERINPDLDSNDPRNWSTSAASVGGTPGKANSVFTSGKPSDASLSISPNPFSPDGDGFEDFCSVRWTLPSTTAMIRIRIYDIRGRLIRTLANTELSGPRGEVLWDGMDDNRLRVRIGPYIVLLEALDGQGGIVTRLKAVVVVATRL